jgi:hypothetical protein
MGVRSVVLDAVELIHYLAAVLGIVDFAVVCVAALISTVDPTHFECLL